MRKTICDYCGREIKSDKMEFTGDFDSGNLAVIKVEPLLLNQTDSRIEYPDFCVPCIIEILRQN